MAPLSVLLIVLGFALIVIGGIWMICQAFCRSILWGLAVMFIPFGGLVYLIVAWSDAKRPFLTYLLGFASIAIAVATLPANDKAGLAKFLELAKEQQAQAHGSRRFEENPAIVAKPTPVPVPPLTQEEKDHLNRLTAREADLRARKAALRKGDKKGAEALSREIVAYNAELQPLLARKKAAEAAGVQ